MRLFIDGDEVAVKELKQKLKSQRKEFIRWNFWAWMMDRHPKIYDWCDKYLRCNTLPF